MKRFTAFLLITVLALSLAGCGSRNTAGTQGTVVIADEETPAPTAAASTPVITYATPTPVALPEDSSTKSSDSAAGTSGSTSSGTSGSTSSGSLPVITPSPTATPVPTVSPTAAPTPTAAPSVKYVTITKNPTGETVEAGGDAYFVAYAENYTSINWILVSPDATTDMTAANAPGYFSGLTVEGVGTSTLHLINIPLSMSGWRVQCYFTGNGGPEYTTGAYLTVYEPVSTDESRALDIAQSYRDGALKKYADYNGLSLSDVMNFRYSSTTKTATYEVEMTKGAVRLLIQLHVYLDDGESYPDALIWYEGDTIMNTYVYGREDSECWNHLEKQIIDTVDYYGGGTAGGTIGGN